MSAPASTLRRRGTGRGAPTRRADRRDARRLVPSRLAGGTLAVWLLLAVASCLVADLPATTSMIIAARHRARRRARVIALLGTLLRLSSRRRSPSRPSPRSRDRRPAGRAVPGDRGVLPDRRRASLDLFAGVALGWKQLVTISLPVGSYEALLVPYLRDAARRRR